VPFLQLLHLQSMKKGYVYILKCANGNFYTGSTINLTRRLSQHQTGTGANYTRKHGPVELVYYQEFPSISQAFRREKQIQGWSHAKKQALIDGDFDRLSHLSKKEKD
ncbi:MAG: GIY-YIG nuclease family protein, partial [Flavobacteriaceae bacterium]